MPCLKGNSQTSTKSFRFPSAADRETIERVFRHLANRYHPDNRDSGTT